MKINRYGLSTASIFVCLAGLASGQTAWSHDPTAAIGPLHWGSLTTSYGTCGTTPAG